MFREWIEESSQQKRTNLVLALDLLPSPAHPREKLFDESTRILRKLSNLVCAVKLNQHLALPLGLHGGVERLVDFAHSLNLPAIMDCKLCDIGSTNRVIVEKYFDAGFDALTASPLPGWSEGLEDVFNLARSRRRGIILVVYLSSKGAEETYETRILEANRQPRALYELFAEKALAWGADGAVVGATRPEKIKRVSAILGHKIPVYAPGVGAQGGNAASAVASGARFLVVGRSILHSADPLGEAESLRSAAWKALSDFLPPGGRA